MERRDPLEEPPVEEHSCEHGWMQVKEPYALHMASQRCEPGTAQHAQLYASFLNSVYPCRVCRPIGFFRWATRHYEPGHDASSCAECVEAHHGRRRGQRVAAAVSGDSASERVRRDLDE